MPRRKVELRSCPDCDGTLRIPLVYPYDTEAGQDARFEIDQGAQCSNQANRNHRALLDDEFKQLVRQG